MRITAYVLDINNNPLPGANVLVVNNGVKTTVGEAADINGKFTIDNSLLTNSSMLQVSYIGFQTRNLTIPELVDENFTIYLLDEAMQGNEFVITGTTKKKSNPWLWIILLAAGVAVAASNNNEQPKKVKA